MQAGKVNTKMNWYALYIASRQEKKVGARLTEKGIENYVPLMKTLRQWSDRKKMVEFPLIAGYVFVHISPDKLDSPLWIPGVLNFVKHSGRPAVVRDQEIDTLKNIVRSGYSANPDFNLYDFSAGEKIKITAGPLKGVEGNIMAAKGSRFFKVLLDSIGQSITVELPADLLIPA